MRLGINQLLARSLLIKYHSSLLNWRWVEMLTVFFLANGLWDLWRQRFTTISAASNEFTTLIPKGPWFKTQGPTIGPPLGGLRVCSVTVGRSNPPDTTEDCHVEWLTAQATLIRDSLPATAGGTLGLSSISGSWFSVKLSYIFGIFHS